MPAQIQIALAIEGLLLMGTCILLLQPIFVFNKSSQRARSVATWGGVALLCVTFCWSFLLGSILALNEITLRI